MALTQGYTMVRHRLALVVVFLFENFIYFFYFFFFFFFYY